MNSVYKSINEVHIEITNMCNLSCTYCYAETLFPGKNTPIKLFTNELYRKTIDKIIESTKSSFLDIVFHGGEPLLHSPEWFEEACSYALNKARDFDKKIFFSAQSNLTILKDSHLDVFKKYEVLIGVSLDGDKEIHNKIRGKYDVTIRNIKKLQALNLFSGVIVVISHHNYDKVKHIFQTLVNLGVYSFHMNIASAVGRGSSIKPLGSDRTWIAWKDAVDSMIYYNGKIIDTSLIEKIKQFLTPPKLLQETFLQLRCDNLFCHAGVTMIAIQNDGTISPCGCAGSSGNMKKFKMANFEISLEEDADKYYSLLELFHKKQEKYYHECVTCPAQFVCEHGCPAFDHTDPVTPQNTCLATKSLYSYLNTVDRGILTELVSNYENSKRLVVK